MRSHCVRFTYAPHSTYKLTNCLRVIRNAWHFYYALILVFKVACGSIGIALLTP
ncbi:DUF3265 domain-containing protein [Vibrio vulnificus]|nr:DUF3265 domain-containing protein [Vibrio vulnificus]TXY29470.1 DUF3265 domain-containing protein [Vibrio mimicus]HAV1328161.1 DUF3265 domain-containing protein [Vibrio parahaemolyticus]EGQ9240348.1 DUF3265 domain-containing protein [Vibrio vulnificus]EGQ9330276.1 DUF3265 domain-containing protein [Vibrio vulnificus]